MTSRIIPGHYAARVPVELAVKKGGKLVAAEEAVKLIRDNDTITVSGCGGGGYPEKVVAALEARFLTTGEPRNLTLMDPSPTGCGEGFEYLMHEGLLKRIMESFFWRMPAMLDLIKANKIEAYCIPLGSGHHLHGRYSETNFW